MSKKKTPSKHEKGAVKTRSKKIPILIACAVAAILAVGWIINSASPANVATYRRKLESLAQNALTEQAAQEIGDAPAGEEAGYAVFISVCDTKERAHVFSAIGPDLSSAWEAADAKAAEFIRTQDYDPVWVKADIVSESRVVSSDALEKAVKAARHEFYRYGVAFDPQYETALLEAELNGAKIYEYDEGRIDPIYLNLYLKKNDQETLDNLPDEYRIFRCMGWLCDDTDTVYPLNAEKGLDYGRRSVTVDSEYAKDLILNASAFLEEQIKDDGSFVYGMYPRFDREIDNYNIVRHASTLWSLLCRYRLDPNEKLAEEIERTIDYMLDYVIYDSDGRAYLYEEKDDEIKLGGSAVAVVALSEYMDAFSMNKYLRVAEALGEGILSMMDQSTGEYYHVLNGDFSKKEEMRTVYYDGEATFALCRLYTLTNDSKWLDAAKAAVAHFIDANYTQYKDHWVAYAMNEITKHVPDNQQYYDFALANAQNNLATIRDRDTTYHTYLELLMATFEVYDRMVENDMEPTIGFDLPAFLDTIATRVDRQLNGYFFPEYAMYMSAPEKILDTFMVRHDGYRVRIDDVQHNIGGYYLYARNYDKLKEYGLQNQQ